MADKSPQIQDVRNLARSLYEKYQEQDLSRKTLPASRDLLGERELQNTVYYLLGINLTSSADNLAVLKDIADGKITPTFEDAQPGEVDKRVEWTKKVFSKDPEEQAHAIDHIQKSDRVRNIKQTTSSQISSVKRYIDSSFGSTAKDELKYQATETRKRLTSSVSRFARKGFQKIATNLGSKAGTWLTTTGIPAISGALGGIGSAIAGVAPWVGGALIGVFYLIFQITVLAIAGLIASTLAISVIMFVINSGGYIVPPSTGISDAGSTSELSDEDAVSCFVPIGTWNPQYWDLVTRTVNILVTQYPSYVNKVCSAGDVQLKSEVQYSADRPDVEGLWTRSIGGNPPFITLYNNLFEEGNVRSVLYTLTHEAGHHIGFYADPGLFNTFRNTVLCGPGERVGVDDCDPYLYTYPYYHGGTLKASEDFAEVPAWYVTGRSFTGVGIACNLFKQRVSSVACGVVQGPYPKHAAFATQYLFN